MRDPTVDLAVKELTEFVLQYLCQRELLELNEAINANFTRKPRPWWEHPPARKRGRPPQRRDRHLQIAGAVALLVEDASLHPTRSHVSRRRRGPSACSIVTAALELLDQYLDGCLGRYRGERLSERAVEDIWNRYRLSPQRDHQGATDFARNFRYGRFRPG
jgi:hypothetical protein